MFNLKKLTIVLTLFLISAGNAVANNDENNDKAPAAGNGGVAVVASPATAQIAAPVASGSGTVAVTTTAQAQAQPAAQAAPKADAQPQPAQPTKPAKEKQGYSKMAKMSLEEYKALLKQIDESLAEIKKTVDALHAEVAKKDGDRDRDDTIEALDNAQRAMKKLIDPAMKARLVIRGDLPDSKEWKEELKKSDAVPTVQSSR